MVARFAAGAPRSANGPSWTWWREGCGTAVFCAGCSMKFWSWRTTNGPTRRAPGAFRARTSLAGRAPSGDAAAGVAGGGRPQCPLRRGGRLRRRRTRKGGQGTQRSTARVAFSQERPGRASRETAMAPRSASRRHALGWRVESAMPAYAAAATPALTARSVGPGWVAKEPSDPAGAPATGSTVALRAYRAPGLRPREQRRRAQPRRRQAR
jgi:hypothetical protein